MNARTPQPCRVCGFCTEFIRSQRVLDRDVAYFDCTRCGYFQTETPHWLAEAYASPIDELDTGILWRNSLNVRRVIMTLTAFGKVDGRVIDHAGGYGILVRLLRDSGVDAYWRDEFCPNLLARGFEAGDQSYDLATAFEVFEHFERPLFELRRLLEVAPVVLISTELFHGPSAPSADWWYLGTEHGQHIGFFRSRTLAWMAREADCHYVSDGQSLHVYSRRDVPSLWRPMQRLQRLAPLIARTCLRSRTVDDFDCLRAARSRR